MIIKYEDKEYKVWWKHHLPEVETSKKKSKRGITECFIEDSTKMIHSGTSTVNPCDVYVKAIGRKISFQKAVENLSIEFHKSKKLIRTTFFREYKRQMPKDFKSIRIK